MEKVKEIFKNLLYIFVIIFCIFIISFVIFVIIINIKSFFNIGEKISSIIKQSNNSETINILSLNLGILQGLTGIIGIGIVIAAYFNFTQIKDKLEKVDQKSDDVDNALKEVKNIVEQHESIIKDFKNMSNNEKQEVQDIENIVLNNEISKLDNIGGSNNEV